MSSSESESESLLSRSITFCLADRVAGCSFAFSFSLAARAGAFFSFPFAFAFGASSSLVSSAISTSSSSAAAFLRELRGFFAGEGDSARCSSRSRRVRFAFALVLPYVLVGRLADGVVGASGGGALTSSRSASSSVLRGV